VIGVVVSMVMAIFDATWIVVVFGLVYGVLIDVVTTKLEDKI